MARVKLDGWRSWTWAVVTVSCALALTGTALAADGGLLKDGTTGGSIDAAEIEKVVAANRSTIVACFEAQRTWSPLLSGTLVYDFDINADGTVGDGCRGDGSTFSPALPYEAEDALTVCIARALKKWRFSAPRGGAVGVSWPFRYVQQPPPLRSP